MIADFCDREGCFLPAASSAALSRSMSASVRPAPKAPICMKLRRETPSQNCWREPRNRSMIDLDLRPASGMGNRWVGRIGPVGMTGGTDAGECVQDAHHSPVL